MSKQLPNALDHASAAQSDHPIAHDFSLLTSDDLHWFNEGSHLHLYHKLGAHLVERDGVQGACFAVWAPNAASVHVIGNFNGWNKHSHPLQPRGDSGIWEGFIPKIWQGAIYKYHITSRHNNYQIDKADPVGFYHEIPPATGSIVWNLDYQWNDKHWMQNRAARHTLSSPISIYEIHLGSWARVPEDGYRSLHYRELAPRLVEHLHRTGFTHVEFLPIMEHPFFGSWGYQVTGFFAPTSRHGSPQDLMFLIDYLHQHDIGVILDWVPSHFPSDAHGLAFFDGTALFEHADPRQGYHPDWSSYIFNYGRHEVRSFLLSSGFFWLDLFHADGLRVDAVASMLYLDYSRRAGEWIPNVHGGRENLEAISFLRRFNQEVYQHYPDVQTIAEESTAWPMVSRPLYVGGLGFGLKWDMGWMHDTLKFMALQPVHRKYHHHQLTFRGLYAFTENFLLPLSHDEVVHGKGSLLGRMPGDDWQKFANLRLLLGNMFAQPAKKLLFMGGEFGQGHEWNHDAGLDWQLTQSPPHAGILNWVADLNHLYRSEPALHQADCSPKGFAWIDCDDSDQSTISWERRSLDGSQIIVAVFNFTPIPRMNHRVGVPAPGFWRELLNSDATHYGGSGMGNLGGVHALPFGWHWRDHCLQITLPPLAIVFFKHELNQT
jgi:1,4-alpha-glucan branching enzyme